MLYFEILTMVALSIINYTCPLCRAKQHVDLKFLSGSSLAGRVMPATGSAV